MISIIICSVNPKMLHQVSESIDETIGIEFEIIAIDNREGKYGICEAYNIGAQKSKFNYLCFIHEDIIFQTTQWGINALNHINSIKDAGVIGLAGSIYKTKMFSSWWQPEMYGVEPKRLNIIQHYKHQLKDKEHLLINPLDEIRSQVASLDGVFLFTKKETWKHVKFDESLLKDFHGYDLDFTLNVGKHKNNYVVFDILLEHFSEGVVDINWLIQNFFVHEKLHKSLPVIKTKEITKKQLHSIDTWHLEYYLRFVDNYPYNKKKMAIVFLKLVLYSNLYKASPIFIKRLLKMILLRR